MPVVALKKISLSSEKEQLFAVEGVSSYEDFVHQAKLPTLLGVSGRVISALAERIGSRSLAADAISGDLHLSKRTLQRHLQQQQVCFTDLRDKVRLNFVLPLLLENELSIDRLSAMLDFTDRTSFTLAFKRWTGLSPNAFRKLFRDYNS